MKATLPELSNQRADARYLDIYRKHKIAEISTTGEVFHPSGGIWIQANKAFTARSILTAV